MAATRLAPLVAFAALLAAGEAGAKVYVEWRPRISLMAGYNDNVLLNGSGADGFGQAVPGIKLDLFGEHNLHVAADCQAGLARLAHPQEFGLSSGAFAANETCTLATRVHLSPRDKLQFRSSATYAQDPFSIAGLGLLLRPGQSDIFVARFSGEVQHALSARTEIDYGVDAQALAFGTNDPGNGYMLAPQARYAWRTSARSKWDLGVREQLFFGVGAPVGSAHAPNGAPGGLLDEGHSVWLGYTYALNRSTDLTVRAGGVMVTGFQQAAMPTARVQLESYTPTLAISVQVAHDLVIGPSTAGPLIGDVAELGVVRDWEHVSAHFMIGMYRNAALSHAVDIGSLGYGTEVGLAWKFTRDLRIEAAALRDARINDLTTAHQVDRNVAQLRLVWEKARFE
ncbi:MAG: hypothetical protein E6J58_07535 [Deltaproteobacteria bacterium]|nr:MAG: hypothetical protein E6J58_07535 [Deltaproteobacteria bacterium]